MKDEQIITLLISGNPKIPHSKAKFLFELYQNGMTVGQYIRLCEEFGYTRKQARELLRWDVTMGRNFIRIE